LSSMATLLKYTRGFLRACRYAAKPLLPQDRSLLKDMGLLRMSGRPRGCKGGRNRIHHIETVIDNRPSRHFQATPVICKFTGKMLSSPAYRHIPERPRILRQLQRKQDIRSGKKNICVPRMFLCNPRSLVNKVDEFQVTLTHHTVDIGVVSETWMSDSLPSSAIGLDGFNLYSRHRTNRRGGGVAVYVKDQIPSRQLTEYAVPENVEAVWVWTRPHRLPRPLSAIVVCGIYSPPASPNQDQLINHLVIVMICVQNTQTLALPF